MRTESFFVNFLVVIFHVLQGVHVDESGETRDKVEKVAEKFHQNDVHLVDGQIV